MQFRLIKEPGEQWRRQGVAIVTPVFIGDGVETDAGVVYFRVPTPSLGSVG